MSKNVAAVSNSGGFDDGGWNDADWDLDDFDKKPDDGPGIDITSKEYKNKNLNKLSDAELAREKQKMDKQFDKNFLKPGDAGYEYDKVIDFKT